MLFIYFFLAASFTKNQH